MWFRPMTELPCEGRVRGTFAREVLDADGHPRKVSPAAPAGTFVREDSFP
jgi:hypothetical protein